MVASQPSNNMKSTLSLAAAMIVLGSSGVFSVLSGQPTFNVVFFRCLFGALFLGLWCIATGRLRGIARIDRSLVPVVCLSGLFLVTNWAALFEAYRLISIGFATIIYHLQTFWIVVFAAVFLNERLTKAKGLWLVVAFAGLAALIWPRIGDIAGDLNWFKGVAFAVLASLLYAGSTLTSRALRAVAPVHLTIIHCLFGVAVFAPFLSFAAVITAPDFSILWLVGLGVIHTGILYIMIYAAYPRLSIAIIGICAFLNPLAAVGFGYVVFGETINLLQGAGALTIGMAALGVTMGWGERRSE
ncbi:DMT family transporter [Cognatishimia activa]|uniref:Carboxylate/amino acid/amine transporter n=1 Tax=Cognatishimia activa TaxID=1715691 RepID=A0A0P1IX02_9RHOB|nr:DMT family transporter [Cognatishimia activa]CUI96972.1 carboxylate/amino acid/amine transporter [Cognatishimia activa]CUK25844.1 carboxylate/amino acid/amine transporter [Cognatishimia activa]